MEDLTADGCALEGFRKALDESSLKAMLREVALQPEFKTRLRDGE
jgi:hypothetical protein